MSKAWPLVKLGELLNRVERFEARNELTEYPFAGTYSFARGIFVGERKIGSSFALPKIQRIHEGDFVYCKIMAWEGAFGLVPKEADRCIMSSAFVVYEPNLNLINPLFLDYFFKVPSNWKAIGKQSTGTNVRRQSLHPNQFETSTIPLPPLAEQQRIVAKIERLAGKIEEANKLNQKIIEEADNVTISIHKKFSGTQKKMIGDILMLDEDKELIKENGEYPQVGVKSFGGGLFPKLSIKGTETTYKNFNRLYNGAIVLSQVKGWEGAIAVCDKNLAGWYVSPEYRTFRCNPKEALPEYMATLVKTEWFWKHLKNATRGVGARRERTRPEQFLTIKIPMPDIKLQKIGQQLFAKIELSKDVKSQIIAELDAMLPSILDRAFKGEL